MENNDVKNNGKNQSNHDRKRPPSQNGGRPKNASAQGGAKRPAAGNNNTAGREQNSRSTQGGKSQSTASKQNAQYRSRAGAGKSTSQTGKPAQQNTGGGSRQSGQRQNPTGKPTQGRPNQTNKRNTPAQGNVSEAGNQKKNAVNNSGKKTTDAVTKRRRPAPAKKREEPIIRKDDYGDGFYTDEVELKRKRAAKEERQLRDQEEFQKEPISRRTRKAINVIICVVILVVVLITGVVLSLTVLFKSEKIEVEGTDRYTQQQVIDASGLSLGENLFLSDKKKGGEAIAEKLPYVESAQIDIKIPNTMVIHIKEATPAYLVADGKEFVVVSTKGRVLERSSKNTYDVPAIKGCKLTQTKVGQAAQIKEKSILSVLDTITKSLQKNKFNGIKEIDITDTAKITLNYADRVKILLGMPEDIDYKIRTAIAIIDGQLAKTDMGILDVSDCNSGKKQSYFNSDGSLYPTEPATQPATQPPTESQTQAPTEPYYSGEDTNTGDNTGDGSGYTGEDTYGDGGYTGE